VQRKDSAEFTLPDRSQPSSGHFRRGPAGPSTERQGGGGRVLLSINCAAGSDMLETTHAFLSSYLNNRFRPQIAQRLSLAVYELFANGLNYGSVTSDVMLELMQSSSLISVRVENDTIPARVQMLAEHLQRIRDNAEATFLEEMRRSVSGGAPRAMLGLVRVAFEAGLPLELTVNGRRVSVSACCRD